MRANLLVHPDKVRQRNGPPEQVGGGWLRLGAVVSSFRQLGAVGDSEGQQGSVGGSGG